MKYTIIAILAMLALTACGARRPIPLWVSPEQAAALNSVDWTIKSQPAKPEEAPKGR